MLDVSVFGPLKRAYRDECASFYAEHASDGTVVTKQHVAALVGKAFARSFTPKNIATGFVKTGIQPLNKGAVKPEPDPAPAAAASAGPGAGALAVPCAPVARPDSGAAAPAVSAPIASRATILAAPGVAAKPPSKKLPKVKTTTSMVLTQPEVLQLLRDKEAEKAKEKEEKEEKKRAREEKKQAKLERAPAEPKVAGRKRKTHHPAESKGKKKQKDEPEQKQEGEGAISVDDTPVADLCPAKAKAGTDDNQRSKRIRRPPASAFPMLNYD